MVMMQERGTFGAGISRRESGVIVLDLLGEVDVVGLPALEEALQSVMANDPDTVIVDLSRTEFVCGDAFVAIGRRSDEVENFIVCSRGGHAKKVFHILGYEHAVCVDVGVAVH